MKRNKKAAMLQWIFALVLLFMMIAIWMLITRPMIIVDDKLSPMINLTTSNGRSGTHVVQSVRNYWAFMPLVFIGFIILWALFSSLKQDPNYPVI